MNDDEKMLRESFTFACWMSKKRGSDEWDHIIVWRDAETNQMHITINNEDCLIDEKAGWNRVLTPAERAALYEAGKGTTYPADGER